MPSAPRLAGSSIRLHGTLLCPPRRQPACPPEPRSGALSLPEVISHLVTFEVRCRPVRDSGEQKPLGNTESLRESCVWLLFLGPNICETRQILNNRGL